MKDKEAFKILNDMGWKTTRSGIRKIKKYKPDFNYQDEGTISGRTYFFRRSRAYAHLTKT